MNISMNPSTTNLVLASDAVIDLHPHLTQYREIYLAREGNMNVAILRN